MTRYERVKQILDESVGGQDFAAHGRFWKSLTRDQFVVRSVFGRKLVVLGDGAASNLVLALKGEAPFGSDLTPKPPGALFPRMPAARPPVSAEFIAFIQTWIDAGCPEDEFVATVGVDVTAGGPLDPALHIAFWRELDNWAMFEATPETQTAINDFFEAAGNWIAFARDAALESAWSEAITTVAASSAIDLLSGLQQESVVRHYGSPVRLLSLLDSMEQFGGGTLPEDPLRPQDVHHNMNGAVMWFFWSAFAEACERRGTSQAFWRGMMRALLVGLCNDGLFRGRFTVNGFAADASGRQAIRERAIALTDENLAGELRARFVQSGLG